MKNGLYLIFSLLILEYHQYSANLHALDFPPLIQSDGLTIPTLPIDKVPILTATVSLFSDFLFHITGPNLYPPKYSQLPSVQVRHQKIYWEKMLYPDEKVVVLLKQDFKHDVSGTFQEKTSYWLFIGEKKQTKFSLISVANVPRLFHLKQILVRNLLLPISKHMSN